MARPSPEPAAALCAAADPAVERLLATCLRSPGSAAGAPFPPAATPPRGRAFLIAGRLVVAPGHTGQP